MSDNVEPGFQPDLTEVEYRSLEAASSSGLSALARSPAYYAWKRAQPDEPTEETLIGTATHAAILQPDLFLTRWATKPDDAPKRPDRRQREAKKPSPETVAAIAWWDEFDKNNAAKVILTREQYATVLRLREACEKNKEATDLLAACPERERAALWVDPASGALCKGRLDAMGGRSILDLKTVRDAGMIAYAAKDGGWHRQEWMYRAGAFECGWGGDDFAWIVLDKSDGPTEDACLVYRMERLWMEVAAREIAPLLALYRSCVRLQSWPKRVGGLLSCPPWLAKAGPVSMEDEPL